MPNATTLTSNVFKAAALPAFDTQKQFDTCATLFEEALRADWRAHTSSEMQHKDEAVQAWHTCQTALAHLIDQPAGNTGLKSSARTIHVALLEPRMTSANLRRVARDLSAQDYADVGQSEMHETLKTFVMLFDIFAANMDCYSVMASDKTPSTQPGI